MRAPLSNASPAASSSVRPSTSKPSCSRTCASSVWPPEAIRQTNGGSNAPSMKLAATWPWRWSTAANGSSRAAAMALAVAKPTNSAPTRPGPRVAPISSTSSSVWPASRSACSTTRLTSSRWWREAISGTTPPKRSWTPCEEIALERTVPRAGSRTAAQVSSQLLSSARIAPAGAGSLIGHPLLDVSYEARVGHVVERARQRGGRAPHDERVLAVVLVVAPAQAGGTEALAFVEVDRAEVGAAYLQREARVLLADARVELGEQRRGHSAAAVIGVDGDVHDVPHGLVARADQVTGESPAADRGEADARGLGELQHEHRQRPRRRERAALDRDHLREIGI